MKKIWTILLLIACLLLSACQNEGTGDVQTPDSGVASGTGKDAETDNDAASVLAMQIKMSYYEGLVKDLQTELLDVKGQLFSLKTMYDNEEKESSQETGEKKRSDFRYSVADGGVIVTAYVGGDIAVAVPGKIDGMPVVAIGDRAFYGLSDLKAVTLPDSITSIGWFAFSGCVSLTSVLLPDSVTSIAYGAFENCPQNLVIRCSMGSYADRYAKSYGMIAYDE